MTLTTPPSEGRGKAESRRDAAPVPERVPSSPLTAVWPTPRGRAREEGKRKGQATNSPARMRGRRGVTGRAPHGGDRRREQARRRPHA